MPGQSGNPAGRAKGLAAAIRELVGNDGRAIVDLFWGIMVDPAQKPERRMEAAMFLADRAFGKPVQATVTATVDVPRTLAELDAMSAAEQDALLARLVAGELGP